MRYQLSKQPVSLSVCMCVSCQRKAASVRVVRNSGRRRTSKETEPRPSCVSGLPVESILALDSAHVSERAQFDELKMPAARYKIIGR